MGKGSHGKGKDSLGYRLCHIKSGTRNFHYKIRSSSLKEGNGYKEAGLSHFDCLGETWHPSTYPHPDKTDRRVLGIWRSFCSKQLKSCCVKMSLPWFCLFILWYIPSQLFYKGESLCSHGECCHWRESLRTLNLGLVGVPLWKKSSQSSDTAHWWFTILYYHVCKSMMGKSCAMVHMWRAGSNFSESALSFHICMGSRDRLA